jgi:parallel beta-helix repeat protein
MKPLFITMALVCALQTVWATDYYFSSSAGNDSYSTGQARNPNTPWRTLDKLNALFPSLKQGDAVYLKRGDVFYGAITAAASGTPGQPITIGAYGSGARPVISGLTPLTAWTSMGGNVWACANSSLGATVNTVLINDATQEMGRYPNSDAPNKGYLNFESFVGNSSITDYQLSSSPNWTGGEVVIRNRMSILDRSTITTHSGNTLYHTSASPYVPGEPGYGYFIQNHRAALDRQGEWYYHPGSKILYVYFSNNNPYAYDVKASSVDNLVTAFRQSNLVFDNLSLKGANKDGFSFTIGDRNQIKNCEVLFSGRDGIVVAEVTNVVVENSTINYSNNNSVNLQYGDDGAVIRNNLIDNTMPFGGMAQNSDGNGIGLSASGNGILLEYNRVLNSGFNGIYYFGSNITIKNNLVDRFCVYKNDGGGIYTHVGAGNSTVYHNRKIIGNIVLHGQGAAEGTPAHYFDHARAEGISLDDAASNVEVTGNTIAHCSSYGLFFTNAFDNVATNNTVYNNKVQLQMSRNNNIVNNVVTNNTIDGNIFFSKDANQMVSSLSSTANDLGNFGSLDNNYYVRPFGVGGEVYNNFSDAHGRNTSNAYSVEDWKPRYNKDASSKGSPVQLSAYTVNAVTSGNKFPNATFNTNTDRVYSWSVTGNTVRTWSYGPLDEGCFKLSFNPLTGNSNRAVVNAQVGSLTGGKTYRLKFSLLGENAHSPSLAVYLRLTDDPYTTLSEVRYVKIASHRTENELIFSVPENVNDASLIFDMNDQSTAFWMDNVELVEVNITLTNPDDHLRFEYNASQGNKTVPLNGTYIDAKGNTYNNSITLAPYTSAVLIKQTANVDDGGDDNPTAACSATGSILREQWDDVQGNSINAIPLHKSPNSSSQLTVLETQNSGQYIYGARIRGYVCPPQSGNYTFWLAGDDDAELWLSTDDNPANKVKIAGFSGYTNPREWDKYSTQQSAFIYLQQGKRYYIEVLHKQGYGGDHVSVAWQLPDASMEAPISGNRLSPYIAGSAGSSSAMQRSTAAISEQASTDNTTEGTTLQTYPNPFSDVATIVVQATEAARATVEVYNISGILVQRLFSGQMQAGQSQRFTLNGQRLPAGVYTPPIKPDIAKVENRALFHNLKHERIAMKKQSLHGAADCLCAQTGGDGHPGGRGLPEDGHLGSDVLQLEEKVWRLRCE